MKRFNVRVYGIHINERNELLVADETYRERSFTKFPGGGLEWGEGTIACLKREFEEEFQLSIQVKDLLYTTDFFQVSTFHHSKLEYLNYCLLRQYARRFSFWDLRNSISPKKNTN
jgi:ADP-ribose pyrophosphatase YjhB (NUDIX family)